MEKLRIFMSLGFLIALHALAVFLFLRHEEFFHAPEPIAILSDHTRDALVARNWLEDKGWTTPVLPLYSLNLYRQMGLLAKGPPWPNGDRFPLPILVSAGLMKMLGKSGLKAVFLDDRLFYLFALIALFFLTLNEFQDSRIAFLTVLLFITNTDLATSIVQEKTGSDLMMAVASLAAILPWVRRPSRWGSLVAGGVCGLSFLMRYNEGVAVFVIALLIFVLLNAHGKFPFFGKRAFLSLGIFTLTFIAILTPLFAYNIQTFRKLFFTIYSQLQIPVETRFLSFTDGFFKLEGPWRDLPILKIIVLHPRVLLTRVGISSFNSLMEFLFFGQQTFIWPLCGYQIYKMVRKYGRKCLGMRPGVLILALFGLAGLILSILTAAPFVGFGPYVSYSLWCYIPFLMTGAAGAVSLLDNWRKSNQEFPMRNSENLTIAIIMIFFFTLTLGAIPQAYHLTKAIYTGPVFVEWSAYLWLCSASLILLGVFFCFKNSVLRCLCVSILLLIPFAMETLSTPSQPRVLDPTCVDAPPQAYRDIQRFLGPHDIVLTTGLPFLAWFTDRPTLGIPEYPELIYSLISDYHLPVRAIFLYKMNVFLANVEAANWSYGFAGYSRISEHLYSIAGFTFHGAYDLPAPQQGTAQLYLRDDSETLPPLLNTKRIEFGDPRDSVHLIYGWGPAMVHDGKRVSLALKNIRRKQPYPQDDWYRFNMRPMTDAEFTFMLRQPFPKKVRFVVKSMGSTHMNVFLNHDLTYYERFEDLDRHRVAQGVSLPDRGWSTVDVVLPPDLLRQGLNKIGFLFSSCKPPDSRLVKADESPAPVCAALEKATFL